MATAGAANSKDSFIFLNEPLGFFDDERRNALINFLDAWVDRKDFCLNALLSAII